MSKLTLYSMVLTLVLMACSQKKPTEVPQSQPKANPITEKAGQYETVRLTTDLSQLSDSQKQLIGLLIDASKIMDNLFWYEAYGDKDAFLAGLDEQTRAYATINYGPWDRLDDNKPFIAGVGEKPLGANYYPADMTKEEFELAELPDKESLYTFIRRNEDGTLKTVPFHEAFKEPVTQAADLLRQAAQLAENEALKKYLTLRAEALLTDEYYESDLAWMDMKDNQIDVVIGPIENYEDKLYNYKTAHEAYVLVKDMEWSKRLERFAQYMPELQRGLPVPDAYKQEKPGTDAELNAYDVVYYAGDCNAGSKTIAINLPNDERVQIEKGTRRLQLKNAMRAKFDKIMVPITESLISAEQRQYVTFDAFFANTMFHEVAHGLGIKYQIKPGSEKETVRKGLKEHYSALEEGKADILGLYMITQLHQKGEIEADLKSYYTTFMAGIFRSARFGRASAHGLANMVRFNFFKEYGAFERNEADNTYKVNFDKMEEAMAALSELILTIQGDGDYDRAAELIAQKGVINSTLQADLDRLGQLGIPRDIVFEQGKAVLGLN